MARKHFDPLQRVDETNVVEYTYADNAFKRSVCGFSTSLSIRDAGDIGNAMFAARARGSILTRNGLRSRNWEMVKRSSVDRKFVATKVFGQCRVCIIRESADKAADIYQK
jgi:hypothetical protein